MLTLNDTRMVFSRKRTIRVTHRSQKAFKICGHFYCPQRKLGEGSVFRGVCLSTGGVLTLCLGGLCPGGGGSLSRGSVRETTLYSNEQVVCILLECILVVI